MQVQKANKKANMHFGFILMTKTELFKFSPSDRWAIFELKEEEKKNPSQQQGLCSLIEGWDNFNNVGKWWVVVLMGRVQQRLYLSCSSGTGTHWPLEYASNCQTPFHSFPLNCTIQNISNV